MSSTLNQYLQKTKLYQCVHRRLDTWYLRDRKTTVRQVLKILLRKIQKDEIEPRANAVAFNLTLSIFPAIIFLFTLIPYIPIPDLNAQIMFFLGQVLPKGIYQEIATTIYDIVSRPRGNLLSLGFFFAMYAATNGTMALINAFNRSYRTVEQRTFIKKRLIAIGLTFMLAFVLFLAVVLLVVGNIVLNWISEHDLYNLLNDQVNFFLISFLQYGVVFLVFFVALSIIYYVAPAVHKPWAIFSVGSIVASVLSILATHLFSFYLKNFASYNKLYGSIGTFIGLMIWLYLLSFIILLGFEINVSAHEAQKENTNLSEART
jgi:membrane protein